MRLSVFFALTSLCLTANLATAANIETLFNQQKPEYYQQEVSKTYTDTPIIKIEGTSPFKEEQDINRPKLKLSSIEELKESIPVINQIYNIKTPFGKKEVAHNVQHTTDFNVQIQIIDNNTVSVQEFIQFISLEKTKISRTIPTKLKEGLEPLNIELSSFEKNGKKINYDIQQNKDEFVVTSTKEYPAGLHMIHLSYIVHNAVQQVDGVTQLFLSTTGKHWPYPVNRFKAIVLYPHIPISYQKNLLFGNNNLSLTKGFDIVTDIKGNTIYTLNRVLPAYGDVRIFETFDGKNLPQNFSDLFFQKYKKPIFALFACVAVLLYLAISSLYLKKFEKRHENVLKRVNGLSFTTLLLLQKKKIKKDLILNLIKIKKITKKSALILVLLSYLMKTKITQSITKRILKTSTVFFALFKHIFVISIILTVTILPFIQKSGGSNLVFIIPIVFSIILIRIFYQKVFIPELKNDLKLFKEKLLSPHICFGLKECTILAFYLRYYQTAYLLNIDYNLQSIIVSQNPNIQLPSIQKKD